LYPQAYAFTKFMFEIVALIALQRMRSIRGETDDMMTMGGF
jgi:hypothetical protein